MIKFSESNDYFVEKIMLVKIDLIIEFRQKILKSENFKNKKFYQILNSEKNITYLMKIQI